MDRKDRLIFISDTEFHPSEKIDWIPLHKYIDEFDSRTREMWDRVPKDKISHATVLSDIIRIHYLSKHKKIWYLDTDVMMMNRIEKDPEGKVFNKRGFKTDYAVIYSHTDTKFFKDLLKWMQSIQKPFRKWIYIKIRNMDFLTESSFIHLKLHRSDLRKIKNG